MSIICCQKKQETSVCLVLSLTWAIHERGFLWEIHPLYAHGEQRRAAFQSWNRKSWFPRESLSRRQWTMSFRSIHCVRRSDCEGNNGEEGNHIMSEKGKSKLWWNLGLCRLPIEITDTVGNFDICGK